eukprot:SAG22_NODE_697_length_7825_cov_8.757831_8_plen_47_part_00
MDRDGVYAALGTWRRLVWKRVGWWHVGCQWLAAHQSRAVPEASMIE